MKKLRLKEHIRTALQAFRTSEDTWAGSRPVPVPKSAGAPTEPETDEKHISEEGRTMLLPPAEGESPYEHIQTMRDQLIEAEALEEEHSRETTDLEIIPAEDKMPVSSERRAFTEDGMTTEQKGYLVRTAEGRLIEPKTLAGGGRCEVCGGNTDRIYACMLCRIPLCFRHAFPWERGHLCPKHYRIAVLTADTWAEDGGGKAQ